MINPWTKVKSQLIYESPWVRLYRDNVIRPDGKPGVYDVVKMKGGIGIVAIDAEGLLYLVGQYRYALDCYSLEIPKGAFETFDSKETPLRCAQRELKEETGLVAGCWQELGMVHTLMGSSNDVVHLFLASDLTVGDSSPEGTEAIKVIKIPWSEAVKLIRAGYKLDSETVKMTDATSIAAILLARENMFGA